MKKLMFLLFVLGLFSMYSCSKEAPVTPDSRKSVLHESVDSRSSDGVTDFTTVEGGEKKAYPYAYATSFTATAGDLSSTWTPTFDYSVITHFYHKSTINIYFRKPGETSWRFIATAHRTWINNSTARFDVNRVYSWSAHWNSWMTMYFMATSSANPPSTLPMTYNPEVVSSSTRINYNSSPLGILPFKHPNF